jgi:dTDP-4-dehydrorhamnose reductase
MNRVAVIGSSGQLGHDIVEALERSNRFRVVPFKHEDIECTKQKSVQDALLPTCAQVVINCAAFVRVDESEDRPVKAFEVNALGALHVARTCAKLRALCVYISTDYVFDGCKGSAYAERDIPCPINVYGVTKLAGEQFVRQSSPRWLIIRTASLFGSTGARGKGSNFVETIIAKAKTGEPLRIVDDIWMSPTYSKDAAGMLVRVLQANTTGLIHLTNQGSCTWYEFATAILELLSLAASVEPVNSSEYGGRAPRPANSSLVSERIEDALHECAPRHWRKALRAYLLETRHLASVVPTGNVQVV